MYKRVAGVEAEPQLADVARRARGSLRRAAAAGSKNLLEYAALELSPAHRRARHRTQARQVSVRFTEKAQIDPEKLAKFVGRD